MKASQAGNRNAKFQLAHCYSWGIGVGKDMNRALPYLKEAAKMEDPDAQNELGVFYRSGGAQEDNFEELAFKWFSEVNKNGHPGAL